MLVRAGAVSVPAVVCGVDYPLRFVFPVAYFVREDYFIADDHAEGGIILNVNRFRAVSRMEFGKGVGNLAE